MKVIKAFIIILVFVTVSNFSIGQRIYRANREAYKSNKFSYEFYLFDDSTCYLKGHYPDNSVYFLYKGKLKKSNDTLYQFNFQPIVNFTCNKGYHGGDSLRFYLTQVDTTLASFIFKFKKDDGFSNTFDLKPGVTKVYFKGSDKQKFTVDTQFIDPLTKKNILYTVGLCSDPDFTYFGIKTNFNKIQISIVRNKLTVYPDHKLINDKDTFILKK